MSFFMQLRLLRQIKEAAEDATAAFGDFGKDMVGTAIGDGASDAVATPTGFNPANIFVRVKAIREEVARAKDAVKDLNETVRTLSAPDQAREQLAGAFGFVRDILEGYIALAAVNPDDPALRDAEWFIRTWGGTKGQNINFEAIRSFFRKSKTARNNRGARVTDPVLDYLRGGGVR